MSAFSKQKQVEGPSLLFSPHKKQERGQPNVHFQEVYEPLKRLKSKDPRPRNIGFCPQEFFNSFQLSIQSSVPQTIHSQVIFKEEKANILGTSYEAFKKVIDFYGLIFSWSNIDPQCYI